jgi:hypothetical protein
MLASDTDTYTCQPTTGILGIGIIIYNHTFSGVLSLIQLFELIQIFSFKAK